MAIAQTTLVIDGLDMETLSRLKVEADRRGVDVPEMIRTLLRRSVGMSESIHHDLDSLAGTWSEEDAAAFQAATGAVRSVDLDLWR